MSDPAAGLPRVTALLAFATGVIVANLYFAQPLLAPIASSLALPAGVAALVVTITQVGYCAGLLFVVPLADIVENRRLVTTLVALCACALAVATWAPAAVPFFAAMAAMGMAATAAQIIVPFAAHLAPDAMRGRAVGRVVSGLLLGIMLSRPVASFVADAAGWHAVFGISAGLMSLLAIVLARALPPRQPAPALAYPALLGSLWTLLRTEPVLRRRAAFQACLFGAFSLFWTAVPLYLASPAFRLTQRGIGLFALAGVAGAIAAPVAGHLADHGHGRRITLVAMMAVLAAFALGAVSFVSHAMHVTALTLAAIVLDAGVSANLVVGQRAIFDLGPERRSRLNGLFLALFFLGGALGSASAGWAYATGGWTRASWVGAAFPTVALLLFVAYRRQAAATPPVSARP
ncbi:MAG: MFS transporter [Proteobacteria bacterium]|nr:MFS transporter [Pseudomonadota bacterium]